MIKDYFELLPIEKLQKFIQDHYMNVIPKDLKDFKKCVFKHGFTHRLDGSNFIYIGFDNTSCKPMHDAWLKRGITPEQLDWDYKLMMAEHFKDDPEYAQLVEESMVKESDKKLANKDALISAEQQEIAKHQQNIKGLKKEKEVITKSTTESVKKVKSISDDVM